MRDVFFLISRLERGGFDLHIERAKCFKKAGVNSI